MAFGKLSDDQREAVREHVRDRVVHDLGAGSCELSCELLNLGAKSVVAIDTKEIPFVDRRIKRIRTAFECYREPISVAFVSWPINQEDPGLPRLLRGAKKVIYLGKNTDGTMCGWPELFLDVLAKRKVEVYLPERKNTLIIYGAKLRARRKSLLGEESAGATAYSGEWVSFEESEGLPEASPKIAPRRPLWPL